MLRLALPLVLAEVGWMSMGVVDTIMVGHLPRPAVTISAAALGQVLYNTLAFGVGGVLLGLDTYISQAHGAGEWDDANKWLLSGVVLAGLLSAVLMGMVWVGPVAMTRMPIDREVMRQAVGFLGALNWGTLPLFLYMTFRRYLQAFNHVRPIAAAVVSANLVNAGLDWLLLFGHRLNLAGHSAGDSGVWSGGIGVVDGAGAGVPGGVCRRGGVVGRPAAWVWAAAGRNECWTGRECAGWCGWARRWVGRSLWRLRSLRR